ncbi:hypothetical protein OHB49_42815 (plasmid) [Streptomyces sp. NBC_01717]|nr:hypothetical protein [Streptomyces sp. NBC_01717]
MDLDLGSEPASRFVQALQKPVNVTTDDAAELVASVTGGRLTRRALG